MYVVCCMLLHSVDLVLFGCLCYRNRARYGAAPGQNVGVMQGASRQDISRDRAARGIMLKISCRAEHGNS